MSGLLLCCLAASECEERHPLFWSPPSHSSWLQNIESQQGEPLKRKLVWGGRTGLCMLRFALDSGVIRKLTTGEGGGERRTYWLGSHRLCAATVCTSRLRVLAVLCLPRGLDPLSSSPCVSFRGFTASSDAPAACLCRGSLCTRAILWSWVIPLLTPAWEWWWDQPEFRWSPL